MLALNPESVKVELVTLTSVLVVAETTCKTFPPPAGATHFKPVVSALSATKNGDLP